EVRKPPRFFFRVETDAEFFEVIADAFEERDKALRIGLRGGVRGDRLLNESERLRNPIQPGLVHAHVIEREDLKRAVCELLDGCIAAYARGADERLDGLLDGFQ